MMLQGQRNPKNMMSLGMLCLATGLLLHLLVRPSSQIGRDWSEGLAGLLVGISIVINLMAVRIRARQPRCG